MHRPADPNDAAPARAKGARLVAIAPCLAVFLALAAAGCGQDATEGNTAGPTTRAIVVESEPGEVVLEDATAVIDDQGILRFRIDYRFESGKPSKHYLCEITFPGTDALRVKAFSPGELTSAGTITTAFEAPEEPAETFEMKLLEADSPNLGFDVNSNTLTGAVTKAE